MSELLVDPGTDVAAGTGGVGASAPVPAPSRGRRLLTGVVAVTVLGAIVAAALLAVPPVELAQAGPVTFDADATHLTLEDFDARGVYSLRYVHDGEAEVRIPVRNDGWMTTTIAGLTFDGRPAPMIEPVGGVGLPVELEPGEQATVAVRVRFDNCEFYTERAIDVYGDVTVATRTAGIGSTTQVRLDHDLLVRSPMMTTCPDRVSDRGAFLRGG